MSDAIGAGTGQAFQPSLTLPRTDQVAEQARALTASQSETVAAAVQRQADLSSNRADALSRQADQLETRAEQTRAPQDGLGGRLDLVV